MLPRGRTGHHVSCTSSAAGLHRVDDFEKVTGIVVMLNGVLPVVQGAEDAGLRLRLHGHELTMGEQP